MKILAKLINLKDVIELEVIDVRVPSEDESDVVFDSMFKVTPFQKLDFIVKKTDFDYDYDETDEFGDPLSAYVFADCGYDFLCPKELLSIIETETELIKNGFYKVFVQALENELPATMIFYAHDEHRLISLGRIALFEEGDIDLGEEFDNEIDGLIDSFKEQLSKVSEEKVKMIKD